MEKPGGPRVEENVQLEDVNFIQLNSDEAVDMDEMADDNMLNDNPNHFAREL